MIDSLAAYPRWFVAACVTVAVATGLFLFAKILKWLFYLIITLVLLMGGAVVAWALIT